MTQGLRLTIKELSQQRERFQAAPGATPSSEELPLLEKQAVIDQLFRGMPIKDLECREKTEPNGEKIYLVTRGWLQLRAIWDFLDGKFPTWSDEDRRRWEQSQNKTP